MIQSSFLFANVTNKMAKLTSSIGICFASYSLYEIHETLSDLHLLLVFQQGVRTNAGNLIYGVRLQVNVGDSLAKKKFQCVTASL